MMPKTDPVAKQIAIASCYLWSFVKIALVASAEPCAPLMERTHCAVTPSHTRTAPSLDAVTYIPPVDE